MAALARRRTLAGLVGTLSLVAVALLMFGLRAEPVADGPTAAIHDVRESGVLTTVARELTPRVSLPHPALPGAAVVTVLAAIVGAVALCAPVVVKPLATSGTARRRAPPQV